MQDEIVNRVVNSGLETINLSDFYPDKELVELDMKDWLFQGLILREKDFREKLTQFDFSVFADKHAIIFCSVDAIVPVWAYMLLTTKIKPYTDSIFFGNTSEWLKHWYYEALKNFDASQFQESRVVIKGCSDREIPESAFMEITSKLMPFVKSIMYGEPCSTVPVYKRPKAK